MMRRIARGRWQKPGWGALVSIALHVAIAAILLVRLPAQEMTPPAEDSVSVELVPPPEENAPQDPAPEEKQAQEDKPPPTPAEAPEEAPQPDVQDAQAGDPPAGKTPIPVLRPVFEFGDKDTGSKGSDIAEAKAPPPERRPDGKAAEAPRPVETAATEKQPDPVAPPGTSAAPDVQPPDDGPGDLPAEVNEPVAPAEGTATNVERTDEAEGEVADTPGQPDVSQDRLTEADKLFSESITDDQVARTAMGNLTRGARIEQLCSTELYAQLRHASPPRHPDLLPSFRLSRGTVLDVRRAAFRAKARWFDLSFRCEVDADATRVVAFAFDVGAEVPKSEWRSRGFPTW